MTTEKTTENTLRQADNQAVIEGVLLEKRIEEKEVNKKLAITGEFDIEVAEGEVHTLKVFSYKLKQDGTENGIFKGLKTVMDEYKSVASEGKEEADKIRITNGQIGINDYYGQDGKLKSFPQLSTNFINRVKAGEDFEPKAEFELELFVKAVIPEVKNEEETGRAILQGFVPLYGGKVMPFTFIVENEGAVEYIQDNYEPGSTVKVYGDIVNKVEITKVLEEVGFGKPKEKINRKTVREYIITGGSEPYDEENVKSYSGETIKKALTEREIYLEELKNKKNEPKKEEKKKGFDTKPKEDKKPKFNTNDLPF
ncbi:hypothetical protein COE51_01460 [Bacillus pseudomycoides]|nr:hypothetical protein COE51_01460 [Bacillus pseudomycoides]